MIEWFSLPIIIRQQFKLIEEEIDRNENDGGNRRSVKR